ncbi:unnamed protein product [Ectocarpus sp. CCAP 1310/34]|nr:unnamed protein product [Ectocarpus sp. CCAP 1310/34]
MKTSTAEEVLGTQGDPVLTGAAIAHRGDTARQLTTERRQRKHNSPTSSHDNNDNNDKRVNSTKKRLPGPEILDGAGRTWDEREYHHGNLRTASAAAAVTAVVPGSPPKQTPLHTAMYGFFKQEKKHHPPQQPPSTALQRLPGPSDEDGSSSSTSAFWSTNTPSSATYVSPARKSLVAEHNAGKIGEASSAAPITDAVGLPSPGRMPRAMPSPPSSAAETTLPPTSGDVNNTPNIAERAWAPSPTSNSRGWAGGSPSSATTASEAASRTPSRTPRAAPSRFRTTEWSAPTPNTSGRGIETPLPTSRGNGESVASPPTARPTEPPSPKGTEARPAPSPAGVRREAAAWSGADEEVGSMPPTAGFRGQQSTMSGSSSFTSSLAVGGTPLAASSRQPFLSGDDGDRNVAAPTSLPASLTGPPVSVGVPIPSPTMGGGRGEEEEGEEGEGISSALQPSSIEASPAPTLPTGSSATSTTPTLTGFHAGFPTNSPTERTRGISFTPSPASSSSTATVDGAGQEESEEHSETSYPSSLVFTAPPSTGGKRERSYAPTSFPHSSPANTASPTAPSMEETRGVAFSPAPTPYPDPSTETTSSDGYPSAPTSSPHPTEAYITASPTASSIEETRGAAFSSAPSSYPDPSPVITSPYPTEAFFTASSTRDSNGESQDGVSSPAPTATPYPAQDSSLAPTTTPTAGNRGSLSSSTRTQSPETIPDSKEYPSSSPPVGDEGGDVLFAPSIPPELGSIFPASSAPALYPDPSRASTMSPTASPTGVGSQGEDVSLGPTTSPDIDPALPASSAPTLYLGPSRASTMSPTASSTGAGNQGGDVSLAPTTSPDVGSALPASSSPTLHPGHASTMFPTASSTGVGNQGGDVSSAPTIPPDVGSALPASSAPTLYPGRASTMSPTASSTGGTQQEFFLPAPSPYTPSPTVGGRGGAGDRIWSTGSPTSSPTFQGRKKVVDQLWPTTAPTDVATAHVPTLPWLKESRDGLGVVPFRSLGNQLYSASTRNGVWRSQGTPSSADYTRALEKENNETGSPTTSHHARGTEQTERPFSAAYWPMTSSSSPTSAPTSSPSPSPSKDSDYASQRPLFSSASTTADGQEDPHLLSFAPTLASSSPGNRGFEFNTASPTSSPSVSSTATASESGWSYIEQDQRTTGFPTTSPSTTPGKTAAPTSPVSTPRSDEDGVSTPTPTRVSGSGREDTPPPPPALFQTLMPTAPSSSSGTPEQGERGIGSDSDGERNEIFSPSGAPTPSIASDGGLDREEGGIPTTPTATPAPTHHDEDLWSWWFQTGGQRRDRGHALVNGVGGNASRRYLVGAEDGVVASDSVASAGSAAEDIALCADAGEGWVAIAGYTTGSLYSDSAGGDDAFLVLLDPDTGDALGGWQFGGEGSERVYALGLDQDSGDVVVGGFTTSSLFATNDDAVSQYFLARLDTGKLLLSPGRLDLADAGSDVVVWGWQYSASADLEAIVSLRVNPGTGVVTALGMRGLPADWSPRDTDFVPEDDDELHSSVFSLELETGDLFRNSTEEEGLAAAVAVDEGTDDAYVASFTRSADNNDRVVVYKVNVSNGGMMWSYQATSEGVFEGRALAIDTVGDSDEMVIVAGTTGGTSAHGSYGSTDAFVLLLGADNGSEICYYQAGTSFADVVTGITVDSSSTAYSDVTLGGYTEGSLAGLNAGEVDMFAIGVRLASLCPDVSRSTSSAAEIEGSFAAGTISILAGVAVAGAVVSTIVAPGAAVASATAAAGASTAAAAAATAGAGAVTTTASTCPKAGAAGVGALVTILSAGHGAGGLVGNTPTPGEASFRSPSASIGLLMMTQLQFLATLSLVQSVHDSASSLSSFVENLRWVNLWLPMPSSLSPNSCEIADAQDLIDEGVFFGNTTLVLAILLGIFLIHVGAVSAVEAYWLAQDRAAAALKSARQMYRMSAADLDRRVSASGRGRFSAVANDPSNGTNGAPPRRGPLDDLISFGDLEEDARSRPSSPAPASSVGSPRCMSPGGRLIRHCPNGSPASRTSGCADGLPSGTERNSNGGWSQPNNRAEWANSQEPMQQQGRVASIPRSHHGDEWSSTNESVSPTTKSLKDGTVWSPAGRAGRTLTPPGRSSLTKRCSDKGGGSLPGSPTRDGYRYGRTHQLYPNQSAVSSVRSASPRSLPWDSPTRDFTGAPAAYRVSRVTHRHEVDISGSGYSNQDRGSGGGEPLVGLLGMASVLSTSVDTAAGVVPEVMSAGTPSLQQRSAAVISDSGSAFGDVMVAYSSVVVSKDGLDGGGGGDGVRRPRDDNCAGDKNSSETPRLFER